MCDMEPICPTKPKIFTLWSFTEQKQKKQKPANPWLRE